MKKYILSSLVFFQMLAHPLCAQNLKKAQIFTRNEQFEDAESVYQILIQKKPKEGPNYYYAAMNLFAKGDSTAAVSLIEQGGINAPKCRMVLVGKGFFALRQGDAKMAENYFQQAQDVSKKRRAEINKEIARAYIDQPYAPESQMVAYAIKAKEYLALATDDFESKLLLGDALMLIDKNDLSLSVQQYIVSGYEEPNDPRPLLKEAMVYRRAQNYDLSKLRVEQALAKDLNYAPAYRQLAEVFQLMNERDSAIFYFQEYLKRNNNLSARVRYVEALYLNSEFDKAISEGKSLLETNKIPNIYGVIAYAYVGKKDANADEIKEGLKYFDLYEQNYVAKQNRSLMNREMFFKANLLYRDRQYAAAWKLFEKVLTDTAKATFQMYDGVKDIYYDLGKDLQKEISQISGKEQSEANTALRQSVEKQKNEAYLNAFKALELKRRKNKDSLNLVDLFYQGRCLNFMERNEDALKIYREIVTQDTNYISGYYLIATTTALIDPVDSTGMVTMAYQKWLDRLNEEQQEKFKKDVENAYRNMAFFAQKNKNFEMTSFYYGKVLEVNPEDEATADIKARIDDYLQKLKAREAKNKNKN
jgi:tetratricopeptide (TPR) repeat protein